MNLNHLYYFQVLAQSEHYTHAAEQLNITQPSLSHAIHTLEAQLGIYLFEKQGRNIRLTKYGKIFYEYVNKGLNEIEIGQKRILDLSSQHSGWIDLGFIYTLGSHYVPHLIRDFLSVQDNKDIKFSLKQGNTTEILQGLKDEKYDVAFCSYVENQPDINFLPIAQEEVVLIVSRNHPLASYDEIDLRMIKDEKIVFYDKESGIRPLIERLFKEVDITPNIICEVEEDSAVIGLVAINYGVALVPDIAMIDNFAVKRIRINNPPHERYIYLATVKNRYLPPSVHTFCNYIIHHTTIQNLHIHK
ncbi:LysR family transcriptional regulator [Amedibacillus sp. YH-ame6]